MLEPLPIPPPPLVGAVVRDEAVEGVAVEFFVREEAVVRGVGGFSTKEVSEVL